MDLAELLRKVDAAYEEYAQRLMFPEQEDVIECAYGLLNTLNYVRTTMRFTNLPPAVEVNESPSA
jgi:hypothetical protein